MGMTIGDHIKVLESYYNGFTAQVGNLQDSIDVAIETMRKYQKICKILDKSDNGEQHMYDTIQEIEEVRDGNAD